MKPPASILATLPGRERHLVALLLAGAIVAGSVAGVAALGRATSSVPAVGGTYREGMVGRIARVNPLTCREVAAEADVCALVFAGLTQQDPESLRTVGDLALKWDVSTNGRQYAFTLREDARFHDGTPVKASDVVFTYKTLLQDPAFTGSTKGIFRGVTMTVRDERTVQFNLQKENAFFPDTLRIGILPEKALTGADIGTLQDHPFFQRPVGAGPFRLVSLTHSEAEDVAELDPVDPASHVDRLVLTAVRDEQALVSRLSDFDGLKEVPSGFDPESAAGWTSADLRLPRYVGLFFNTDRPTVSTPKVRQALAMSVPRDEIVKAVAPAEPVWAPLPSFERRGAPQGVRGAMERADELLIEAGWRVAAGEKETYKVKGGKKLVIQLAIRRDPAYERAAHLIRDAWGDLGVTVSIVPLQTYGDLESILKSGEYDALMLGISTANDLDLYPLFHSSQVDAANYANYKDLEADLLMEKVRKSSDTVQQREAAGVLIDLLQKDAPAVFLYTPMQRYAYRTHVRDVAIPPRLATVSDRFSLFQRWAVSARQVWDE